MSNNSIPFELQPALPTMWIDEITSLTWWTTPYPGPFTLGWIVLLGVVLVFLVGAVCLIIPSERRLPPVLALQLTRFGVTCVFSAAGGLLLIAGRVAQVPGLSIRLWWVVYWITVLYSTWYFWEVRWPREKKKEQERTKFSLKQKYLN